MCATMLRPCHSRTRISWHAAVYISLSLILLLQTDEEGGGVTLNYTMLPAKLSQAGYATHHIGK